MVIVISFRRSHREDLGKKKSMLWRENYPNVYDDIGIRSNLVIKLLVNTCHILKFDSPTFLLSFWFFWLPCITVQINVLKTNNVVFSI